MKTNIWSNEMRPAVILRHVCLDFEKEFVTEMRTVTMVNFHDSSNISKAVGSLLDLSSLHFCLHHRSRKLSLRNSGMYSRRPSVRSIRLSKEGQRWLHSTIWKLGGSRKSISLAKQQRSLQNSRSKNVTLIFTHKLLASLGNNGLAMLLSKDT